MSNIKPSSHGIVVDHIESNVRYAISDKNYNQKVHRKVRDLKPGETVLGFRPKRKGDLVDDTANQLEGLESSPQTEGSSTEGTKDNK